MGVWRKTTTALRAVSFGRGLACATETWNLWTPTARKPAAAQVSSTSCIRNSVCVITFAAHGISNDSIYNDASLHRNPESMRQAALLAESGTVSQARHQNSAVAVAQMAVLHSLTGILAHKTNAKSLCAARTIFWHYRFMFGSFNLCTATKNNNYIKCLTGPQFTQAKSTAHARRTHRYWNLI